MQVPFGKREAPARRYGRHTHSLRRSRPRKIHAFASEPNRQNRQNPIRAARERLRFFIHARIANHQNLQNPGGGGQPARFYGVRSHSPDWGAARELPRRNRTSLSSPNSGSANMGQPHISTGVGGRPDGTPTPSLPVSLSEPALPEPGDIPPHFNQIDTMPHIGNIGC